MNSYPEYCPIKNSLLISPSGPSLTGVTRLTRNMVSGSAPSLNIIPPPSLGPHHRLCFPYESCQSEMFMATYESSKRPRSVLGVGVSGGTGKGGEIARPKSACDMASRAASGRGGAEGEC